MSTTRTRPTTIARSAAQALVALAVVVTAWAIWTPQASAYEPVPVDPPWEYEPVPLPVDPVPFPTPGPTIPLPEGPSLPDPPFDPGDIEILPLPAVNGSIEVNCLGSTQGELVFTAWNNTSTFLEFFEGTAHQVSDMPAILHGGSTIVGPTSSDTFTLGPWNTGADVYAKLANGSDTLVEGTYGIDCGVPNPAASHDTVCMFPGGFHTYVELSNTGNAPADFFIEFVPTDPGVDGATGDSVIVLPGGNHTHDRVVVHGATYHLKVTAVGEPAPLIDTTFSVDCPIIDDTAPTPGPTPGGSSDPAPTPGGPSDPAPTPGGSSDPAPSPGGPSDPAPTPGGSSDPAPGASDGPGAGSATDDGSTDGGDSGADRGDETTDDTVTGDSDDAQPGDEAGDDTDAEVLGESESRDGGDDDTTGVDESATGTVEGDGGGSSTPIVVGVLAVVGLALLATAALMHARSRHTV